MPPEGKRINQKEETGYEIGGIYFKPESLLYGRKED